MRSTIELPSLRDHFKQESLPPFSSPRPRELLPSILNHSPPGRSSTLPPIQRRDKFSRPRKSSITQSARKPKQDRPKSKEFGRRPSLGDRKALSAEPQTAAWAQGKRWEDLIEAATSATEADDERYSEVSFQCDLDMFVADAKSPGWSVSNDCPTTLQRDVCSFCEKSFFATTRFPVSRIASTFIASAVYSSQLRCFAFAQSIDPTTVREPSQPGQRLGAVPIY